MELEIQAHFNRVERDYVRMRLHNRKAKAKNSGLPYPKLGTELVVDTSADGCPRARGEDLTSEEACRALAKKVKLSDQTRTGLLKANEDRVEW